MSTVLPFLLIPSWARAARRGAGGEGPAGGERGGGYKLGGDKIGKKSRRQIKDILDKGSTYTN